MPQVWKWTSIKEAAALDIWLGELTQPKIAEKHGISLATLESWVRHDEFHKRLEEHRQNFQRIMVEQGVPFVTKEQRIISLARMAASAREQYEDHMLLETRKQVGHTASKDPVFIISETYNRDAFDAYRGALDDIAKELGHRKTNVDVSGSVDVNANVSFYMPTPETPPSEE